MFQNDERLVGEFIANQQDRFEKRPTTELDLASEALELLWEIMSFENNGTTSRLVDYLRFCAGETTSTGPTMGEASVSLRFTESSSVDPLREVLSSSTDAPVRFITDMDDDALFPWLNVPRPADCDETYQMLRNHINATVQIPYGHIQRNQEFFNVADEYFRVTYYSNIHEECFNLKEEGKTVLNLFFSVRSLLENFVQSDDLAIGLGRMEELVDLHKEVPNQIPKSTKQFNARLEHACTWQKDFSDRLRQEANVNKENIARARDMIRGAEHPLRRWLDNMDSVGLNDKFPTDNMKQYLDGKITKHELARQFLSKQNTTRREEFSKTIDEMKNLLTQYEDQLYLIRDFLWHGYQKLRESNPIVIINDTSVQRLELVKKAESVRQSNMQYFAREGQLNHLIPGIPDVIKEEAIQCVQQHVMMPLYDMREKLKMVETNLRVYEDSIEMDTQFYL